jgi:hypothetical protein
MNCLSEQLALKEVGGCASVADPGPTDSDRCLSSTSATMLGVGVRDDTARDGIDASGFVAFLTSDCVRRSDAWAPPRAARSLGSARQEQMRVLPPPAGKAALDDRLRRSAAAEMPQGTRRLE